MSYRCACRASRLAALGLLRGAQERWLQRLAELDALAACLGLPALHALLLLAPSPSAAAALAEAAVQAAQGGTGEAQEGRGDWDAGSLSAGGGGGSGAGSNHAGGPMPALEELKQLAGPRLRPHEAAAAARWWFRHLHAAPVPAKTVQALQARRLGCLLLEYCRM